MPIAQALSGREANPLDDRSVIQRVPDDVVFASQETGDDTEIDLESRREDNCILLTSEGSQLLLQREMSIQRTVEEATPSTARTVFLRSRNSSRFDFGVIGQPEIRVRSKHQDLTAIDDNLSILVAFYLSEVGINPSSLSLLWLGEGG